MREGFSLPALLLKFSRTESSTIMVTESNPFYTKTLGNSLFLNGRHFGEVKRNEIKGNKGPGILVRGERNYLSIRENSFIGLNKEEGIKAE